MADLFSSLRSLLPQELHRGNSSTNDDDIEEATKYIKNLELSIKELGYKRDMLKNNSKSSSLSSSSQGHEQGGGDDDNIGSSSPPPSSTTNIISSTNNRDDDVNDHNYVKIHRFARRLEIEISVKVGGNDDEDEDHDAFPLSKLLKQVSLFQGLDVVSCLSSKVNDTCKCLIHCDLANNYDEASSDFSELQRRLATEISSYVAA